MEENAVKETYNDEIDLYDLLLVLKKRAKLIGSIVFASVAITTIVVFLMPNIYQGRATVWVDLFVTPALIQNLQTIHSKESNKVSFILPAQPNRREINNLAISILNSFEIKSKIAENIKKNYGIKGYDTKEELEKIFQAKVDKKNQSITITAEHEDKKIAEAIVKMAVEELDKELEKVSENYKNTLMKESETIKNTKLFVVNMIEKPFVFDDPVKPKKKLIIAVSCVSALFVGMFLAFVLEWWDNIKRTRAMGNN